MENRLEIIIKGVHELLNRDLLTKITYVRLSEVTNIKRSTLTRAMDDLVISVIDSLNENRWFKTEKVSEKFRKFVDDYDKFKKMSILDTTKELNISQDYYYKFLEIIELNK